MAEKALKTSVFTWEGTDRKGGKVKGSWQVRAQH